ncbi:hypothetical protein GDO81_024718 [Engystomops pustulosus]|uniref:Uncharacterized protein n=1 Tax=Engystomops pustulosus TaxID=76066 RepID=A0AAV6YMK4_ENGPU|nr:hypothetical protein GDO81_024718 [Engystomops pustulosus]
MFSPAWMFSAAENLVPSPSVTDNQHLAFPCAGILEISHRFFHYVNPMKGGRLIKYSAEISNSVPVIRKYRSLRHYNKPHTYGS